MVLVDRAYHALQVLLPSCQYRSGLALIRLERKSVRWDELHKLVRTAAMTGSIQQPVHGRCLCLKGVRKCHTAARKFGPLPVEGLDSVPCHLPHLMHTLRKSHFRRRTRRVELSHSPLELARALGRVCSICRSVHPADTLPISAVIIQNYVASLSNNEECLGRLRFARQDKRRSPWGRAPETPLQMREVRHRACDTSLLKRLLVDAGSPREVAREPRISEVNLLGNDACKLRNGTFQLHHQLPLPATLGKFIKAVPARRKLAARSDFKPLHTNRLCGSDDCVHVKAAFACTSVKIVPDLPEAELVASISHCLQELPVQILLI
mmetsp:Transcript_11642/g.32976  ORF Transcript_11642/g.32976 Transcript_11642/m.32976 type:complete len:322 (+) Transcript_11642:2064-3029(+)